MLSDYQPVIIKLPRDLPQCNLYVIADVHIGDPCCDKKAICEWVKRLKSDPCGYFVAAGDMLNMGLKNSKTNIYEEKYLPRQQIELFRTLFAPVKDKLLAIVPGNHEYRAVKEIGINPLYDVALEWGIGDRYRENFCALDLSLGHYTQEHTKNQVNYGIVISHGSSRLKHDRWCDTWDGVDLFISGHTHDGSNRAPGKLVFDRRNKTVTQTDYYEHVCTPMLQYGGYGARAEYHPGSTAKIEMYTLTGDRKHIIYKQESL